MTPEAMAEYKANIADAEAMGELCAKLADLEELRHEVAENIEEGIAGC